MACEYRHRRRVEFADTDMAGIVHFGMFFRYVEEAEHAFLRSLGLSVHPAEKDSTLGFPRVSARCEYQQPARFEDELEIHLWIRRKGRRSLVYQFRVRRGEDVLAQGEIAVICCRTRPRFEAVELPAAFAQQLEEAPCQALEFKKT